MPLQHFKPVDDLFSAKPLNITKRIHFFTMITTIMQKQFSFSFERTVVKKGGQFSTISPVEL